MFSWIIQAMYGTFKTGFSRQPEMIALHLGHFSKAMMRERVTQSAFLVAYPRQSRIEIVAAVEINRAGLNVRGKLQRGILVARPYTGRKAKPAVVHQTDSFFISRNRHDANDWSETLLLHHFHIICQLQETGRFKVVAAVVDLGGLSSE